jgi:hypothetical protein
MSKKKLDINLTNLDCWLRSTGYFLPETDQELIRFEKLYSNIERQTDDNKVDPIDIINNTRVARIVHVFDENESLKGEINQLRMAARKHTDLPDYILDKIKKNQSDNNESNRTENKK